MNPAPSVIDDLVKEFGGGIVAVQKTVDNVPTVWVDPDHIVEILRHLKHVVKSPYGMLFDLFCVDERLRSRRGGLPDADFTVVYHLLSLDRNEDLRVKAGLLGEYPSIHSVTRLWPNAEWYEREAWDLFGVTFEGHPHLRRLLMPPTWEGHPLRKEHPARATELGPFRLPAVREAEEQKALQFRPGDWGMKQRSGDTDFMFLNLGPQHPGTHGLLRIILELDSEEIVDAVMDIGYHHRGAEKMAERQTWHTFIPYTDRIDYLGGALNNLPYLLAVEKLGGIRVPEKAQIIRVMISELFRIASHLVWYGTFAQDVGALSPVFYMFTDREKIFGIIEAVCGGRMHPGWFRIGGVAHDLPRGWDGMIRDFLGYLPKRLEEYDAMVMRNGILRSRTKGIGAYTLPEAVDWGVTGPGLRACGLGWDFRKVRPYSGYEQFSFEIPTATGGDCYDRAVVRVEEMRQSLRIIEQCLQNMPDGPYKSDHPLATPPRKERTMHDIETLITHFLNVSWGPVMPAGESSFTVEASKGANSYSVISDGGTNSYRTRIRTPSFAHLQMVPKISRGLMIPDLMAILGSIDFVLADVDR